MHFLRAHTKFRLGIVECRPGIAEFQLGIAEDEFEGLTPKRSVLPYHGTQRGGHLLNKEGEKGLRAPSKSAGASTARPRAGASIAAAAGGAPNLPY